MGFPGQKIQDPNTEKKNSAWVAMDKQSTDNGVKWGRHCERLQAVQSARVTSIMRFTAW